MLTLTDLFCGAGGSALGATAVPGIDLRIAANHWQLAVESHAANFPDAAHDCADISQVDVRRYPSTDLLWASPECTNHSIAQGRKRAAQPDLFGETLPAEAAERSRATMWDVPRFAEYHGYRAIVVENVVDAGKWSMWPAWLHAMQCLGYRHQLVFLNSMHAPTISAPRAPQSRDRLYVVFTREGDPEPEVQPRPLASASSPRTPAPAAAAPQPASPSAPRPASPTEKAEVRKKLPTSRPDQAKPGHAFCRAPCGRSAEKAHRADFLRTSSAPTPEEVPTPKHQVTSPLLGLLPHFRFFRRPTEHQ